MFIQQSKEIRFHRPCFGQNCTSMQVWWLFFFTETGRTLALQMELKFEPFRTD